MTSPSQRKVESVTRHSSISDRGIRAEQKRQTERDRRYSIDFIIRGGARGVTGTTPPFPTSTTMPFDPPGAVCERKKETGHAWKKKRATERFSLPRYLLSLAFARCISSTPTACFQATLASGIIDGISLRVYGPVDWSSNFDYLFPFARMPFT